MMNKQQTRQSGKSFSEMIQLKMNIEKGLKCAVATLNPEKTKRDFEYMTGSKLNLQARKKAVNVYDASLALNEVNDCDELEPAYKDMIQAYREYISDLEEFLKLLPIQRVSGALLPLDVHKKARELSAGEFINWWFAQKQ
jgi:hypothetical protein